MFSRRAASAGFVVFVLSASSALGGIEPSLCVASAGDVINFASDCVPATKDAVNITAAPVARHLVWLSRDSRRLTFGIVAAGETRVSRPKERREIAFDIRGMGKRRVNEATVRVLAGVSEHAWQWTWRSSDVSRRHTLQLPEGSVTVEVSASGFRTVRQTFDDDSKLQHSTPFVLQPLPVISGTVIMPDGSPAVGAIVTAGTRFLPPLDGNGHFAIAIDEDWPETISVEATGLARKVLEVPNAEADVDLGAIKLVRGGTLAITLDGERAAAAMDCEVLRGNRVVRTAAKKAAERRISFEALEPGRYQLRFRGPKPLQIFAARVVVEEGRLTESPITISPHTLTVSTFLGNEKLPDATVWLMSMDFRWEASLKTGGDSQVTAELWQPGQFVVSAEAANIERRYADLITVEDVDEPELVFRLPNRKITGLVTDDEGTPVGHATITLETQRPGPEKLASNFYITTDDTGHFTYRTVAAGHQKLTVAADGFLSSEPFEFELQDGDSDRDVPMRLKRGVERKIVVVDRDDVPIGEAVVVETAGGHYLGYRTTDFTGALSFQLPGGEERTLFIIPRQGSFAVAHVSAASGSPATAAHVVVPPALASLDVATRTRAGAPVANIWFLVRYRNEMIPLEVLQLFDRVQGLKFFTDGTGARRLTNVPVGMYELWPVMGGSDARDILRNASPVTPVRVELTPGENSAVLTFAPAERSTASAAPPR